MFTSGAPIFKTGLSLPKVGDNPVIEFVSRGVVKLLVYLFSGTFRPSSS
jgi:hypothetical protein